MRLQITTRTGHFNLLNPGDESNQTRIAIYDDENKLLRATSCRTEYRYDSNDVDEAINLLQEADDRTFISTSLQEWRDMRVFLEEHFNELQEGNKKFEISSLEKEIEKLTKKLADLKK